MTELRLLSVIYLLFQLTSSRRGWPFNNIFWYLIQHFNSHPHEEDDNAATPPLLNWSFQLTSSRRGWQIGTVESDGTNISTHILTKRMTVSAYAFTMLSCISTHILTKRMTSSVPPLVTGFVFQLTSSRRGWRIALLPFSCHNYFNSHPHEEDDFQWPIIYIIINYFNSHPHEEDDVPPGFNSAFLCISTHILTKRMTFLYMRTPIISIFQLTSSRRGWQQF